MVRLPKVQRTNYASAATLGHHMLPCVFVTKEGASEVDTEDAIEVIYCG
jgi:hypothetical protein